MIVEAHGGQLSAAPNTPHGAIYQFTQQIAVIDRKCVIDRKLSKYPGAACLTCGFG
jgi:hypothetical protein